MGEEKFLSDASEIMDMLLKTHTEGEQLPADDPQTSYLISAWSRICRIMGELVFLLFFIYFDTILMKFYFAKVHSTRDIAPSER